MIIRSQFKQHYGDNLGLKRFNSVSSVAKWTSNP
jgi:hypothetical protein